MRAQDRELFPSIRQPVKVEVDLRGFDSHLKTECLQEIGACKNPGSSLGLGP